MSFPASLINKRVPSTFMGERLFFDLSQGLFSSFKIDDGSRLLLKTLAQHGELERRRSLLDIGCGTGVLGLSVAKRFPAMKLHLCDRDVLALEMSRHNAELNRIGEAHLFPSLMDGMETEPVDLLLSNVPAKAGDPVHRAFLADLGRLTAPGGLAALVIVTPLADRFRSHIAEFGHTVLYEEKTANHLVLHIAPEAGARAERGEHPLGAAFRLSGDYTLEKREYRLDTVYGLPEFDTPGYGTVCAASVAREFRKPAPTLFINPGQGHLAVRLSAAGIVPEAGLLGRDLLQLRTTEHNCRLNGKTPLIDTIPSPWPDRAVDELAAYGRIVMELDPVPGASPVFGSELLRERLPQGGELLLFGRSAEMHTALKEIRGFEVRGNRKYRGTRATLLRKC